MTVSNEIEKPAKGRNCLPRIVRPYRVVRERSEMGRSSLDIECPCCGRVTTAYKWSLAGSGKKCLCGAKHTMFHGTIVPNTKS